MANAERHGFKVLVDSDGEQGWFVRDGSMVAGTRNATVFASYREANDLPKSIGYKVVQIVGA